MCLTAILHDAAEFVGDTCHERQLHLNVTLDMQKQLDWSLARNSVLQDRYE